MITRMRWSALVLAALTSVSSAAQTVETRRMDAPPASVLRLREVLRLGSLDGRHDAFGRVMDVALDGRGRILVADDRNHHVVVFDADGRYVGTLGRRGGGPGEFESPWKLAVDARDSVFVWDMTHARISVFGPDLMFARSFRVVPRGAVGSLGFLPDGRLLLAAYATGEAGTLHLMDREGRVLRSFGPGFSGPDLAGFDGSLLGGTAAMLDDGFAYATRSPYELWFFAPDGRPRRRCVGQPEWTTRPAAVVRRQGDAVELRWGDYVHLSRVLPLEGGRVLALILDPGDRTTMDVVTADCRILQRTVLPEAMLVTAASGDRLAAVVTDEYPQVVILEGMAR